MVIFWIKVRRFYRDLSSQPDPARKNCQLEVIPISVKIDISH